MAPASSFLSPGDCGEDGLDREPGMILRLGECSLLLPFGRGNLPNPVALLYLFTCDPYFSVKKLVEDAAPTFSGRILTHTSMWLFRSAPSSPSVATISVRGGVVPMERDMLLLAAVDAVNVESEVHINGQMGRCRERKILSAFHCQKITSIQIIPSSETA